MRASSAGTEPRGTELEFTPGFTRWPRHASRIEQYTTRQIATPIAPCAVIEESTMMRAEVRVPWWTLEVIESYEEN
jgi:hypothetical protein